MVEVDKAIKGGDFDKILVTTTLDGIRIEPLYTATDIAVESDESGFPGFAPLTRGGQIIPRASGISVARSPTLTSRWPMRRH